MDLKEKVKDWLDSGVIILVVIMPILFGGAVIGFFFATETQTPETNELYVQGLKEGIILGALFEECNLEEQVRGVIDNPTEYCYDKFIGQKTLEDLQGKNEVAWN